MSLFSVTTCVEQDAGAGTSRKLSPWKSKQPMRATPVHVQMHIAADRHTGSTRSTRTVLAACVWLQQHICYVRHHRHLLRASPQTSTHACVGDRVRANARCAHQQHQALHACVAGWLQVYCHIRCIYKLVAGIHWGIHVNMRTHRVPSWHCKRPARPPAA